MDLAFLDSRPLIVALAGLNGAGKTTFYHAHLADSGLRFVNADDLAHELKLGPYEAADTAAALRAGLVARRESFVFETVFSDPHRDGTQSVPLSLLNFALTRCARLRFDIHRVHRLTGGHVEAVSFRAAEADVRANLGQQDLGDAIAVGGEDRLAMNSPARVILDAANSDPVPFKTCHCWPRALVELQQPLALRGHGIERSFQLGVRLGRGIRLNCCLFLDV